nr:reverse transcriptase domain-containing protein [Tanacetum cinerariifolium]
MTPTSNIFSNWSRARREQRKFHMHLKARSMVAKAIRQGYYWPTMHRDARDEIRKCNLCQIHSPIPKLPKTLMTSIMAPWPFFQWGIDVLEISMPTHQTMMIKEGDGSEEEMRLNLDLLKERREAAAIREAGGELEKVRPKMERTILGDGSVLEWLIQAMYNERQGDSLKTSNGETPYTLTFRSEAVIPAELRKVRPKIGRTILGGGSVPEWLIQGTYNGRQ